MGARPGPLIRSHSHQPINTAKDRYRDRCINYCETSKHNAAPFAHHEPEANEGRKIRPSFVSLADRYLHDSLTIFTAVTFKCPCSLSLFVIPLSLAASFASSFILCIVAFETTPVAVTV